MFRAFDPVVIRLSLDTSNIQREKIVFELVEPYISGFSVEPMDIETTEEQHSSTKRKLTETNPATVPAPARANADETAENPTSKTKVKKNKKLKK